jgi:hypothetical protein
MEASNKNLDRDSFIGKMQFFFPSFFDKLSSDEFNYLKDNERWVHEIFGDFWDLLLKKVDDSGFLPGLVTEGLGIGCSPRCSPSDTQPLPPLDCVLSVDDPSSLVGSKLLSSVGKGSPTSTLVLLDAPSAPLAEESTNPFLSRWPFE